MLKPPTRAARARGLLCEAQSQEIRGVKIEWSSVYPPGGNPFLQGDRARLDADTCLKAGVDVSGKLSTSNKGKVK